MSVELDAIEALAVDNRSAIYRLTPVSYAVLFYATRYWLTRENWLRFSDPSDVITDNQWDTIQGYVEEMLYEVKNPVIGYIVPFATADPPPNVLPCDGSEYLREDFPVLYDVLDPIFIVDDDHFTVPDLRGRTVVAAGSGGGLTTRNVGDLGGQEVHQLTTDELASHSHTIGYTITTPVLEPGEVPALTPVPILTQDTGSTGGDAPHENMQPFYVLNYGIIAG